LGKACEAVQEIEIIFQNFGLDDMEIFAKRKRIKLGKVSSIGIGIILSILCTNTNLRAGEVEIELTKSDILKVEGLRSTRVSIFGVKLGDSIGETENKLSHALGVAFWHSGDMIRIGIEEEFKKNGPMQTHGIGTFKFLNGKVEEMSVNEGFVGWLIGDTRQLVESSSDSNIRRKLLGVEDLVETKFGKRFVYLKEGIVIWETGVLEFVYPPKQR
jgi:hypothetical protein